MPRKKYVAHAIYLSADELAGKLTDVWIRRQQKLHRWLEWWEPKSIPLVADSVCRDLFHFDPECLAPEEKCLLWVTILDNQIHDERTVVFECCLATIYLAENGGWKRPLAIGAQETLKGK